MPDWPRGVGRRVLDIVDSTNSEAMRSAVGIEAPQWIFAHRQTAGRGRQGKPWLSLRGNFAATLAMPLNDSPDRAALRSFVAALALRDAILQFAEIRRRLQFKWPNDLLLEGGKIAGILLEFVQRAGSGVLLIGFGVNLSEAPAVPGRDPDSPKPTCLAAGLGLHVLPLALLDALAPAFDLRERQFAAYGFAPIRGDWLAHAHKIGEAVTVRAGGGRVNGVFRTIDESGRMVVDCEGGPRAIAAAEAVY